MNTFESVPSFLTTSYEVYAFEAQEELTNTVDQTIEQIQSVPPDILRLGEIELANANLNGDAVTIEAIKAIGAASVTLGSLRP